MGAPRLRADARVAVSLAMRELLRRKVESWKCRLAWISVRTTTSWRENKVNIAKKTYFPPSCAARTKQTDNTGYWTDDYPSSRFDDRATQCGRPTELLLTAVCWQEVRPTSRISLSDDRSADYYVIARELSGTTKVHDECICTRAAWNFLGKLNAKRAHVKICAEARQHVCGSRGIN